MPQKRSLKTMRPVTIETNVNMHAEGSALISMGNTKVICLASVEKRVPDWLKDSGRGWVTAEYGMLPRSTSSRMRRDRDKTPSRSLEISRLIGRSLRAAVNLEKLGPQMITVDCDVIQADGGTRTAAITGGMVALTLAVKKLQNQNLVPKNVLLSPVAAISVGIVKGEIALDLDYELDHQADVDMNIVMNAKNMLIEIQGSAEHHPFSKKQLDQMLALATPALKKLTTLQQKSLREA